MTFAVEPCDGPELDRLITALLNATGGVFQMIEGEKLGPGAGGVAIIDRCAKRSPRMADSKMCSTRRSPRDAGRMQFGCNACILLTWQR